MSHERYPSHPDELADQDVFRAARRDGLYSTDSAAILQLSSWGTPLSVYLDKVEPLVPSEPASLQAWLGWRLESSLAELYAERYGADTPMAMPGTYTHAQVPFVKTHLDYADGAILVECKTRSIRSRAWGPDGSAQVPVDVWVQVQHELMVTGFDLARIPVLFGLWGFHVYEVPADPVFQGKLLAELDRFWREHVLAKKPPELTAFPRDVAWSKRHELKDDTVASATPEQEQLFSRVRMARLAVSQAEKARDALDAQVRELIGEQAGIMGAFGQVTWRPGGPRTDWKLLAGTLRKAVDKLVPWAPTAEADPILDQLQVAKGLYTTPGSRRLDYRFNEEGANDE